MKKSLAALSATTLGLFGAAAAAAAPAQAALPADCATISDHNLSATATGAEDWYMDCTPLYGIGKAEFTISSGATPFPADFLPLADPAVSSAATSTTSGAAVDAYTLRNPNAPAGMTNLSVSGGTPSTPSTQTYDAQIIVPVDRTSLLRLDPTTPPAECSAGTYNLAYRFDTLASTTTFTQVASGTTYTYNVVTPAITNFVYLNASAGAFTDAPQCVTDGTLAGSLFVSGSADPLYGYIVFSKATSFFGETLTPYGTSAVLPLVLNSAVAPAAAPALAATGTDPQAPTLVGVALIAAGAIALAFRRRRRTAAA